MWITMENLPTLVKLHTSKSGIFSSLSRIIYSSGSAINLFQLWLLPTPLAAIFIQNMLSTEG